MVADQLFEQLWGAEHAMGRPILGTIETVSAFTREALMAEFTRRFRAGDRRRGGRRARASRARG
jgi:predicted Zn-dependent peptidase